MRALLAKTKQKIKDFILRNSKRQKFFDFILQFQIIKQLKKFEFTEEEKKKKSYAR